MEVMVWSALASLGVWFLLPVLLFGLLGWWTGRFLGRHVPEHQDHLPRHLVRLVPWLAGLAIGGLNGLHMAVPQAVLAVGDASLQQAVVVAGPWHQNPWPVAVVAPVAPAGPSPEASAPGGASPLVQAWRSEWHDLSPGRLALLAAGKMLLGPFFTPVRTASVLLGAWRDDVTTAPRVEARWPRVWRRSRPDLARLASISVWASTGLGLVYLLGLGGGALVLVVTARRDLRRWDPRVGGVPALRSPGAPASSASLPPSAATPPRPAGPGGPWRSA